MPGPTRFTVNVEIAAPHPLVWSVMTDVERWPEWTASVSSVRLLTPGVLRVGSRVRILQPGFPPAWWRVTELRSEEGFTWVSTVPGLRVVACHELEARSACCRVTLAVSYEGLFGPAVARWTREVTERYLGMESNGLKAYCEADAGGRVKP